MSELVGRKDVLEILTSSASPVIVLMGPAGMGKSVVVRALPLRCLVAQAWPPPTPALAPVVAFVSGLMACGADPTSANLGAYAGILTSLLAGTTGQHAPTPHPVALADALHRLWALLPVPRRPVLVLEDLHWADEETWGVVQRLAERSAATGCRLVVTTRNEGSRGGLLGTWAGVTTVELAPLGPDDVRRFAECRLGRDVPDSELAQLSVAEGVPLVLEELLTEPTPSGLPATVEARIARRMEELSRPTREFVERAAVLGPETDTSLLAGSFGLDAGEVGEVVREAVNQGILAVVPGSGTTTFRHDLVRDAVLAAQVDLQRRGHAEALLDQLGLGEGADAWAVSQSLPRIVTAARLATIAQRQSAADLHLATARGELARGAPLAAAEAARAALTLASKRTDALLVLTESLSLAGDVAAALDAARRLDTLLSVAGAQDPEARRRSANALARAHAHRGDWAEADRLIAPLASSDPVPEVAALASVVALQLGRFGDAEVMAHGVLSAAPDAASACEAMEVLGRLARRTDLAKAADWFARGVALADANALPLWRARALHELATIDQLRSMSVARLYDARDAAVAAGAPGLVTAVDFHLSAVHGVRFETDEALAAGRRLLEDARQLGATGQEAWAWILIGQGHAVAGRRHQASAAAAEALRLAAEDDEIAGLAAATLRGLPALLREDLSTGLAAWVEGITHMRALPAVTPLPPWYLWPIIATVHDLEGDGGARARAETEHSDLRTSPGFDALWYLACAVAAGRAGDVDAARSCGDRASALLAGVEEFDGWRLLGQRWVTSDALAAGWGEPAVWMTEGADYFGARGLTEIASACRALGRSAGAKQRRRGRGDSSVPEPLVALGVTSREVDVLRLVAEGLTNAEVAERLVLSPRTVKGYVEQLLAKTGASNRTALAAYSPPRE